MQDILLLNVRKKVKTQSCEPYIVFYYMYIPQLTCTRAEIPMLLNVLNNLRPKTGLTCKEECNKEIIKSRIRT